MWRTPAGWPGNLHDGSCDLRPSLQQGAAGVAVEPADVGCGLVAPGRGRTAMDSAGMSVRQQADRPAGSLGAGYTCAGPVVEAGAQA